MIGMTPAQEQALDKISILIREHFIGGVCIVMVESDDEKKESLQSCYHGGISRAIGMLEIGKVSIMKRGKSQSGE